MNNVVEAIDQYCSRLRKALHKVPTPERDEIVREVRSHILERVEAEPNLTEDILAGIFRAVGDDAVGRVERGGVVAFLATLVGYGCAVVFVVSALLKPVFLVTHWTLAGTRANAQLRILEWSVIRDGDIRNLCPAPSFVCAGYSFSNRWSCARASGYVAHSGWRSVRRAVFFSQRRSLHGG